MSRLASLRGPSSPSPQSSRAAAISPSSPPGSNSATQRVDPTPFHRKLRLILVDFQKVLKDWEDVVLLDGVKAARGAIDSRTLLDNAGDALNTSQYAPEVSQLPSTLFSKLKASQEDLDIVLFKLDKRLLKLSVLLEASEALLINSLQSRGLPQTDAALWTTWSLSNFNDSLTQIFHQLVLKASKLTALSKTLGRISTDFEDAKTALEAYARVGVSEVREMRTDWEDLMGVEVPMWIVAGEGK